MGIICINVTGKVAWKNISMVNFITLYRNFASKVIIVIILTSVLE